MIPLYTMKAKGALTTSVWLKIIPKTRKGGKTQDCLEKKTPQSHRYICAGVKTDRICTSKIDDMITRMECVT